MFVYILDRYSTACFTNSYQKIPYTTRNIWLSLTEGSVNLPIQQVETFDNSPEVTTPRLVTDPLITLLRTDDGSGLPVNASPWIHFPAMHDDGQSFWKPYGVISNLNVTGFYGFDLGNVVEIPNTTSPQCFHPTENVFMTALCTRVNVTISTQEHQEFLMKYFFFGGNATSFADTFPFI